MRNEQKHALRQAMRLRKAQLDAGACRQASAALWQLLEQHPRFAAARTVLLYHSLPDEVYTHDFVERWKNDKVLLLPVVVGDELELRRYTGRDSLRVGAYGIEEPAGAPFVQYEQVDVAVVPGVAFDREGHRLGRGKGYYDRLLPRLSTYNIGVCFSFQAVDAVPCEPFDRPMDAVLTEEGWLSGR